METGEVVELIRNIHLLYSHLRRQKCKEFGMQPLAFDMLIFYMAAPEGVTAKDFSISHGVKPNVVSFHTDKLVKAGYLCRVPDSADRRKIRLVCTEKAKGVLQKAAQEDDCLISSCREGLSDSDIECCRRCLTVFNENIKKTAETMTFAADENTKTPWWHKIKKQAGK